MSVISNCRFLLVSSSADLIDPLQVLMNKMEVLHFEKALMCKAALSSVLKATQNGHYFQYIIVDEDSGTEDDAFSLYNNIKKIDKLKDTKFIYIKSSVDSGSNDLNMKSSFELQEDEKILLFSKPLDPKLLIKDLEIDYNKTFGPNIEFIESIPVDDCIIYRMAPVIDRTIAREMEKIIKKAIAEQENTLIFNFKNTISFPGSEMKHISQLIIKSQKDYPYIHTTSFSNKVVGEMRKTGFTQVFDTKTTFKDLISKYQIDTVKLKKAMASD